MDIDTSSTKVAVSSEEINFSLFTFFSALFYGTFKAHIVMLSFETYLTALCVIKQGKILQ